MTDTELTQVIQDIVTKALENKAQPFRPILYLTEFVYYYRLSISTKIVIKTLRDSAKKLFNEYCKDVINGISDVTKLLAYSQILDIKAFYENDLKTVKQMLDDYDEYLGNFRNFIGALFGERREV